MKVQQYKNVLLECLVTLRHARTFVTSREKMHPTGVELYDQLIVDVEGALKAPEPASALETSVEQPPYSCECGHQRGVHMNLMDNCSLCECERYVEVDIVAALNRGVNDGR